MPPLFKVEYFARIYAKMHKGILASPHYVREIGGDFDSVDFVFMCIDDPSVKRPLVDGLIARDLPFIDVGMGITQEAGQLGGSMRTTFSAAGHRDHRHGIPFVDVPDEYDLNIQIADLNALNAALAVVRWKKHLGFYRAANPEFSSIYTNDFNRIDNADRRDS